MGERDPRAREHGCALLFLGFAFPPHEGAKRGARFTGGIIKRAWMGIARVTQIFGALEHTSISLLIPEAP